MKRARMFVFIAAAISLLGVASIAVAGAAFDGAKPATARFHDVDKAIAAGYSFRLPELSGKTCITQPGEGAMGVHMVNLALAGDPAVDVDQPEALVYEPRNDGTLKLVALEYVVFQGPGIGAAVALRTAVRRRPCPEPVRPAGLLRAARVDLEAQPERDPEPLEPERGVRRVVT